MARLGSWVPFERVPAELAFFTRTPVSVETARRLTETAGVALEAVEADAVTRLEQDLPDPPQGPAVQQLSADGAMVPLVQGIWTEVKTVALGTITPDPATDVHATDVSVFARCTDAATFGRLATRETHRRGTPTADTVVAVTDGAAWLQEFIDLQRPDAIRILDFPHAVEHLFAAAHAAFGEGSLTATAWLDQQCHELKHGDPDAVLVALAALPAPTADAATIGEQTHAYLTKRRDQIRYAAFQAAGYPIGDGMVESANKLVVEARLKGSGMHWARKNVNPMLVLRTVVCNDRWDEAWPQCCVRRRQQRREQARHRRQERRRKSSMRVDPATQRLLPPTPAYLAALPAQIPLLALPARCSSPKPKLVVNGKPSAAHPWRRFRLPGSPHIGPHAKE